MAEGKKSFVLYSDLIHTVSKMPMDKRGELLTIILEYVNDLNPTADDMIVDLVFEPIKRQMKRDLVKYEERADRSRENGKLGGRPPKPKETQGNPKKPSGLIDNPDEPRKPDTVNVTVNDNVIKKKDAIAFSFTNELISLGVEDQVVKDWLKVRRKKKATDSFTSLNAIKKQILISGKTANECIKLCVEKDWKGFNAEWVQDSNRENTLNVAAENAQKTMDLINADSRYRK